MKNKNKNTHYLKKQKRAYKEMGSIRKELDVLETEMYRSIDYKNEFQYSIQDKKALEKLYKTKHKKYKKLLNRYYKYKDRSKNTLRVVY